MQIHIRKCRARVSLFPVLENGCTARMDKSLRQHIIELESRIHLLSEEVMQNQKTLRERNRIETELRVAQQALELYQQAIQLEEQLQPPGLDDDGRPA